MNKRILSICLALALCLSLIPAAAFADSAQYTYQEVKTGVKATNISMMGNGMGSFKIINDNYELTSKGVIDPSGKVILTRIPQQGDPEEGTIDVSTHYASNGTVIVDLQAFKTGEADTWTGCAYDVNLYSTDGKLITTAAQIIADYDKVAKSEVIPSGNRVFYGNDGYLTVYAYRNGMELDAYIIDLQTLKVVFKQLIDDGSPKAEGDGWFLTSVNEGLIGYNHSSTGLDENGNYQSGYVTAGWMDLNGTHKLSVDTSKYGNWWNFSDGMAIVANMTGMIYGYVDRNGREVIPCKYYEASAFKDGYAYVQDEDGRYGYIDKTGRTVIPFNYEYAFGYGGGLFTVGHAGQYDNYYGMVDKNNTEVVPFVYTDISIAKNGIAYAIKDGEIVILKFAEAEPAPQPAPADPNDVTSIFEDVPAGAWYAKFLQKAYDSKIIAGTSATTYAPTDNLNHGQIMVMAANLHSKMKGDNYDFQANKKDGAPWYQVFQDYCKAEGIIDERFDEGITANVTRAEMAYYFARTLDDGYYKDKQTITFTDMPENGYDEYIMKLARADIVGGMGDGIYAPGEPVTRAQASVFISNILDAIADGTDANIR